MKASIKDLAYSSRRNILLQCTRSNKSPRVFVEKICLTVPDLELSKAAALDSADTLLERLKRKL